MKINRKKPSIAARMYLSLFLMALFAVTVTGTISFYQMLKIKNEDRDTLISNVASMVANLPEVQTMLLEGGPDPAFKNNLDELSTSISGLDLIVICDPKSKRLYHTNHERIGGSFIGGDETPILEGSDPYISIATGSMGLQRRAFHSVTDEKGRIIGFVMVSVLNSRISQVRNEIISSFLLLLIFMFLVSSIIAAVFRHRLEMVLLGYRPEEFANLFIEREEVLDVLEEGLFAIDRDGKVLLMNSSAKRMLELDPKLRTEGHYLTEYYPETRLPVTAATGVAEHNINFMIKGKNIISSRIPIRRKNKTIGAVSIFRNKTEVTKLAEELTGTKYLVDTLRAANHEFMNKLHVILGLLEMEKTEEAKQYIANTSLVSGQAISDIYHRVPISSLAALLIGKMLRASELGITFVLKHDTYFYPKDHQLPTDCFVTIAGNLIENAIDELNSRYFPVKQIELGIYSEEGHTMIVCDDTGGGIPEEILFSLYDSHTTTKGEGHGNGYALMKEIVDRYEGTFHIDTEPGEGSSIEIILPI